MPEGSRDGHPSVPTTECDVHSGSPPSGDDDEDPAGALCAQPSAQPPAQAAAQPSVQPAAPPSNPDVPRRVALELLGLPSELDGAMIRRAITAARAEIARSASARSSGAPIGAADGTPNASRFDAITVRVVDDVEMIRLHARHCGDPSTTDVLTFCHAGGPSGVDAASDAGVSVDLAICVDVARREAATRGHPVEHELILYVVHGLLHCVGHSDHEPQAFDAMHTEEDRILAAIGIGATFGRGVDGDPGLDRGREGIVLR